MSTWLFCVSWKCVDSNWFINVTQYLKRYTHISANDWTRMMMMMMVEQVENKKQQQFESLIEYIYRVKWSGLLKKKTLTKVWMWICSSIFGKLNLDAASGYCHRAMLCRFLVREVAATFSFNYRVVNVL